MRLLIALVVWIAAAAGAAELSVAVAHSIHNPPAGAATGASGSGSGVGGSGSGSGGSGGGGSGSGSASASGSAGAAFDASSVKPTDSRSLLRTANFARALALVREHLGAGAKLENLALYPGYLAVTAVRRGTEVDVYVAADGTYTQSSGGDPGDSPLFSLTRVKTNVPAALAQRIAGPGHVPESQLNYMVVEVDPIDHQLQWLVYPRQGNRVEYFQAPGATGPLLEYLSNGSTGLQAVRG
jgi:hypothetical protein